tara:strand:+ start:679 stop:1152 length:474 start_codon:yes stop_codon:yes gene_type:complete
LRILGIDPGLACTGFGVVEVIDNQMKFIDYGAVKTKPKESLNVRLNTIFQDLRFIIDQFKPSVMSVEQIFYGKNVKSALLLGHARGVPLLLSAEFKLTLYEFSPRRIKQSLTGNGNASKEQVQFMVQKLLSMKELPNPMDASDALAAAICYNQNFRI